MLACKSVEQLLTCFFRSQSILQDILVPLSRNVDHDWRCNAYYSRILCETHLPSFTGPTTYTVPLPILRIFFPANSIGELEVRMGRGVASEKVAGLFKRLQNIPWKARIPVHH